MNIHTLEAKNCPNEDDVKAAMGVLRDWVAQSPKGSVGGMDAEIINRLLPAGYPDLRRSYPEEFLPDKRYLQNMPDLQNGPSSLIRGENRQIQHVGISNFKLPINYKTVSYTHLTLPTSQYV